ncbi:hypothetical protein ABK040_006632 [Willaertia magna]
MQAYLEEIYHYTDIDQIQTNKLSQLLEKEQLKLKQLSDGLSNNNQQNKDQKNELSELSEKNNKENLISKEKIENLNKLNENLKTLQKEVNQLEFYQNLLNELQIIYKINNLTNEILNILNKYNQLFKNNENFSYQILFLEIKNNLQSIITIFTNEINVSNKQSIYNSFLNFIEKEIYENYFNFQLREIMKSLGWYEGESMTSDTLTLSTSDSINKKKKKKKELIELCKVYIIIQNLIDNLQFKMNNNSLQHSLQNNLQNNNTLQSTITLKCIKILSEPFSLRFHFHFYGNLKTNKLERPQLFFGFIEKILNQEIGFLQEEILPLIKYYSINGDDLNNNLILLDPVTYFCNLMIGLLSNKVKSNLNILKNELLKDYNNNNINDYNNIKDVFILTINESVLFEQSIKRDNPLVDSILDIIVKDEEIYNLWIKYDLEYIKNIVNEKKNDWTIHLQNSYKKFTSDEEQQVDESKCSISSYWLLQSLAILNDRYKYISDCKVRLKFFNNIHIYLLNDYLKLLNNEMENNYLRNIYEEEENWKKYCSQINSAIYVENLLRDWSEFDYMLEMSERSSSNSGGNIDGIFDGLANDFALLADQMIRRIITLIIDPIKFKFMNKYLPSLLNEDGYKSDKILQQLIDNTSRELQVLKEGLTTIKFHQVWRGLCHEIDNFIMSDLQHLKEFNDILIH